MSRIEIVKKQYNFYVGFPVWRRVVVRGDKREPSARGHNWATLFLGDINTGTWPSKLGESQMRQ
jgi:hypothetical protein